MGLAQILASIVSQVGKGTPLWKISVPASIHTDQSALEIHNDFVFTNQECLRRFNRVHLESDPVSRMGLLISSILNIHYGFRSDKPFNPVLGEFIIETATISAEDGTSQEYKMVVEQISHHPPITCFQVTGPNFELLTREGIVQASAKFGINSLEFESRSLVTLTTKSGLVFEWNYPGFKLDGLTFGKKHAGIYGDFWLKDPTGLHFKGRITKPHHLTGTIFDNDQIVDTVSGDMTKKVILKNANIEWFPILSFEKLEKSVPLEVKQDPFYSANIWEDVFRHMRNKDFKNADIEKVLIEDAQRERAKKNVEKIVSRHGFTVTKMLDN